MSLTSEQINKIAELSRLKLTDEEHESFRQQISSILEYVGQLSEVDVSGVEPMSHSVPLTNVLRADQAESCSVEERAAVFAAFPESEDGLLKVKAVFE